MQLRPTELFTIARQLDDPLDTDTYFVQAYVRKAIDDTLLDTVNLTDKTDQRFRGDWEVPADGGGEGFYVTVTTKVFTDSGYTSESDIYGREEREYLVQDRMNPNLGGSGGGSDVDYKKVRKIIKEELEKIEYPVSDKVDLTSLKMAIDEAKAEIMMIDIPTPEKTDLAPVLGEISRAIKAIEDKHIPEPLVTDLSGLEDTLKDNKDDVKDLMADTKKTLSKVLNAVKLDAEYTKRRLEEMTYYVIGEEKKKVPSEETSKKTKRKLF